MSVAQIVLLGTYGKLLHVELPQGLQKESRNHPVFTGKWQPDLVTKEFYESNGIAVIDDVRNFQRLLILFRHH